MTDYLWAKTENIDKLINNALEEQKQKLISKFLYKIRHIPLFWAIFSEELREVYQKIDEIRDYYQKKVKK